MGEKKGYKKLKKKKIDGAWNLFGRKVANFCPTSRSKLQSTERYSSAREKVDDPLRIFAGEQAHF